MLGLHAIARRGPARIVEKALVLQQPAHQTQGDADDVSGYKSSSRYSHYFELLFSNLNSKKNILHWCAPRNLKTRNRKPQKLHRMSNAFGNRM